MRVRGPARWGGGPATESMPAQAKQADEARQPTVGPALGRHERPRREDPRRGVFFAETPLYVCLIAKPDLHYLLLSLSYHNNPYTCFYLRTLVHEVLQNRAAHSTA